MSLGSQQAHGSFTLWKKLGRAWKQLSLLPTKLWIEELFFFSFPSFADPYPVASSRRNLAVAHASCSQPPSRAATDAASRRRTSLTCGTTWPSVAFITRSIGAPLGAPAQAHRPRGGSTRARARRAPHRRTQLEHSNPSESRSTLSESWSIPSESSTLSTGIDLRRWTFSFLTHHYLCLMKRTAAEWGS
jgi:hypothetical protein